MKDDLGWFGPLDVRVLFERFAETTTPRNLQLACSMLRALALVHVSGLHHGGAMVSESAQQGLPERGPEGYLPTFEFNAWLPR